MVNNLKKLYHKDKDTRDLNVQLVKIPVVNLGLLTYLSIKKDELLQVLSLHNILTSRSHHIDI